MKPKTTWILIANANVARVIIHSGIGKGLKCRGGLTWHAETPVYYSDRAGIVRSIAGPGVFAVEQHNPKVTAQQNFALQVNERLIAAAKDKEFDRLVLIAAPHMLGVLRKHLAKSLMDVVIGEIDKDLSYLPIDDFEKHLVEIMAV